MLWFVFLQQVCVQVKKADIVVSAIGQAKFVKGDWIKEGAVVIDVGTNSIPGWRSRLLVAIFSIVPRRRNQKKWSTTGGWCGLCDSQIESIVDYTSPR